jgi:hypothetical protein
VDSSVGTSAFFPGAGASRSLPRCKFGALRGRREGAGRCRGVSHGRVSAGIGGPAGGGRVVPPPAGRGTAHEAPGTAEGPGPGSWPGSGP